MPGKRIVKGDASEAANPETSPERLAELAKNAHLAPLVAANPNSPVETLLDLARAHPREFLANPILPLLHLEDPRQLTQIGLLGALAVLRLDDIPRWLTDVWIAHHAESVREAARLHVVRSGDPLPGSGPSDAESALAGSSFYVMKNERFNFSPLQLPDWIVLCLSRHRSADVRDAIVGSDISVSLLVRFSKQRELRRAVAGNANTPPDVLRQLSHDADAAVREAVARNPHVPGDLLKNLSRSQSSQIRAAVAAHACTPVAVLTLLAEDNDPQVRTGVADNSSSPATLLATLRNDRDWKVREAVAANANTPDKVLRRLIHDQDRKVSRMAQATYDGRSAKRSHQTPQQFSIQHRLQLIALELRAVSTGETCFLRYVVLLTYPDLPAGTLAEHAESLFWAERYVIARHPNADHATLKQLAQDGNHFVRATAQERLAADDGEGSHGE